MNTKLDLTDSNDAIENQDISPDLQEHVSNPQTDQAGTPKKNRIHNNAAYAASLWRNTTDRVDPHRKTGFIE